MNIQGENLAFGVFYLPGDGFTLAGRKVKSNIIFLTFDGVIGSLVPELDCFIVGVVVPITHLERDCGLDGFVTVGSRNVKKWRNRSAWSCWFIADT